MSRRTIASVLLLSACAGHMSANRADPAEARAIATGALSTFVESWNAAANGDSLAPRQYGSLYWPDAELVDPTGRIWDGRPAITQMHVDLWRGPFRGSHLEGGVRRVRTVTPTVMIVDFDFTLTLAAPPGAARSEPLKAHLKHIMERRGDDWNVLAAQNTFEAPPAGPQP